MAGRGRECPLSRSSSSASSPCWQAQATSGSCDPQPQGAAPIARHLWRMCFALLIAALSFFIGQADEFPPALRIMPLLALPMLIVLGALFYWLWRVRVRRTWTPVSN